MIRLSQMIRLARIVIIVPLLISALPAAGRASPPDSVPAFRDAQITLFDGTRFEADMIRVTRDTVTAYEHRSRPADALIWPRDLVPVQSLDMPEVARLEVSKNDAGKGAVIGAVAGAGALCVWFGTSDDEWGQLSGAGIVILLALFTGAGAGVGATTGAFFHHWETVYEPESGLRVEEAVEYTSGVGYQPIRAPGSE